MTIQKMSEQEAAREIGKLPGWTIKNGTLYRKFEFADFVEAFGFMTRAALASVADAISLRVFSLILKH